MCKGIPTKRINSLKERSAGIFLKSLLENPNIMFIHDLKKNVGPRRYRKNNKKIAPVGNKSKKKEKNNISETKKIEPGNPRKINMLSSTTKNNLGHM